MIIFCTGIIVGVLFLGFILHYHKHLADLRQQVAALSKEITQYQHHHSLLVNADLVFAKQLNEINRQFVSMDNQLQALENKRDNDGSYQHALRILEMGGDKEEIIGSCHLSNAEAELLMNLNAYRTVIKKTPQTNL
ncbi:TPA: DUF2802 domain-containing protein [Legionella feeleii]|uniref:Protein of uncharacterized function (DUF2802) n=1 Tax=Legionella feeleii TaxID=453 RepID=A0A0W0U3P8_9GAMM|nr:DUF2802 domain-containing protein [Legionella feeleii]KTD02105.1 hypothetical protein Lfee_0856 [Legionella feeleii]SPX62282.1 Protein of uncharacterised function (DUF2802) [Legionella feeleii]STX37915.1 Protein of uncharacterised function (DUF2802) [Legionella feeleii]